MNDYSIDISKEIWENLPPHKRQAKRLELIELYLSDLSILQEEILSSFNELDIKVNLSAETGAVEWFLNKTFDPDFTTNYPDTKKIWILNNDISNKREFAYKDEEDQPPKYAYKSSEKIQAYYVPHYSYKSEEFSIDVDFIIYYESDLGLSSDDIIQLKGLVDLYKFNEKKYIVIEE